MMVNKNQYKKCLRCNEVAIKRRDSSGLTFPAQALPCSGATGIISAIFFAYWQLDSTPRTLYADNFLSA
jgi:hypothetical protein